MLILIHCPKASYIYIYIYTELLPTLIEKTTLLMRACLFVHHCWRAFFKVVQLWQLLPWAKQWVPGLWLWASLTCSHISGNKPRGSSGCQSDDFWSDAQRECRSHSGSSAASAGAKYRGSRWPASVPSKLQSLMMHVTTLQDLFIVIFLYLRIVISLKERYYKLLNCKIQ